MHYIYAMKNNKPIDLIKKCDLSNYDKDIMKYVASSWYWEYFEHYKGNEYSVIITNKKLEIRDKIHTKDLFKQFDTKLNREQCWDKAIEMGFKWNVLEGMWIKSE